MCAHVFFVRAHANAGFFLARINFPHSPASEKCDGWYCMLELLGLEAVFLFFSFLFFIVFFTYFFYFFIFFLKLFFFFIIIFLLLFCNHTGENTLKIFVTVDL